MDIDLYIIVQYGTRISEVAQSVMSPIVGTPAYEAGIMAGDIITKISAAMPMLSPSVGCG